MSKFAISLAVALIHWTKEGSMCIHRILRRDRKIHLATSSALRSNIPRLGGYVHWNGWPRIQCRWALLFATTRQGTHSNTRRSYRITRVTWRLHYRSPSFTADEVRARASYIKWDLPRLIDIMSISAYSMWQVVRLDIGSKLKHLRILLTSSTPPFSSAAMVLFFLSQYSSILKGVF